MRPFAALVTALSLSFTAAPSAAQDMREAVALPAPMRAHMLANMRDHLAALGEIAQALATLDGNAAAEIAEARLGLSSLERHGARHLAGFMPPPMQEAGTAMHRAASRLALQAQTADIEPTKDSMAALFGAYGDLLEACNACHAAYRLE